MTETADKLNTQAIHLASHGEYTEAIACIKRALIMEKHNYYLWFNLGITYQQAGDLTNARKSMMKAYSMNRYDQDVLESLAIINFNMGKLEEAAGFCYEGLDYNPTNPRLWNMAGVVFFNKSDYISASESFERAVSINPFYYDALFNLRDTYSELGNISGMNECIRRMENMKPSDGEYHD